MKRNSYTSVIHSSRFKVTLIAFILFLLDAVLLLKELIDPDKKHAGLEWTLMAAIGLFFVLIINSAVLWMRARKAGKETQT